MEVSPKKRKERQNRDKVFFIILRLNMEYTSIEEKNKEYAAG
tara:strand:- start:591 stop:716 length:126 start_codon:yes stop_codon:yes gene_type:complete